MVEVRCCVKFPSAKKEPKPRLWEDRFRWSGGWKATLCHGLILLLFMDFVSVDDGYCFGISDRYCTHCYQNEDIPVISSHSSGIYDIIFYVVARYKKMEKHPCIPEIRGWVKLLSANKEARRKKTMERYV